MHAILRRVPFACLLLALTGTLTAAARLYTRQVQEGSETPAVGSPNLPAAYGEETARPARCETTLTYTSLDAPGRGEATADVVWDDAWFTASETVYNHELARTSSVLAALAYSESGYYQSNSSQPAYMEDALAELGFGEVCTESYRFRSEVLDEVLNLVTDDADGVAYTIARKRLASSAQAASTAQNEHEDPVEGQASKAERPRDVILVSVRGSYGSEWLSNLDLSRDEADDHGGYCRAAQEICHELDAWAQDSMEGGAEVSVLLVGHSRGGAIANLVAAELDDCRVAGQVSGGAATPAGDLGARGADAVDSALADRATEMGTAASDFEALASVDSVYAYTFASPATTLSARARSACYDNIFNIANPSDVMPYLPLGSWGYERYGIDMELPAVEAEGFEARHVAMRKAYERSVGVACGADPADKHVVEAVVADIAEGIGSVEDLVTPRVALAVFTSVAARVDPVRILYSHYPSTYIAWLDAIDADAVAVVE